MDDVCFIQQNIEVILLLEFVALALCVIKSIVGVHLKP